MAATNGQNLDILISSTFNGAGFTEATKALNAFTALCNKFNGNVIKVATEMEKLSASMGKMGTGYGTYLNNMQKVNDYMNGAMSKGYGNYISKVSQVQEAMQNLAYATGTSATKSASAIGGLSTKVGGAVSNMKGYFNGLINTSISVGDVFSYYIGSMALEAVFNMTIGIASMRNEMETTFEYMGQNTATVKAFSKELLDFAVQMPTLSIQGVNQIARTLALGGAALPDIEKYKQTWADMAEIASSLNGISAEAAAAKVGPAITDAMGGQYKRLLNVANITATQFKAKAKEMDLATDGSFTNTMLVIKELISERGLGGVASKMTSLSDVWNYTVELMMAKGSELGDIMLPTLIQGVTLLGNVMSAIPTPIFAIGLGLVALVSGIMVFMPIIASVINSFAVVGQAVNPVTKRIDQFGRTFQGWEKVATKSTFGYDIAKQFEQADKASIKAGTDMAKYQNIGGVKVQRVSTTGGETEYYQKVGNGVDYYTKKVNGANESITKFNKSHKDLNNNSKSTPGLFNRMSNGFSGFGTKIKSGIPSIKSFGSAMKGLGSSIATTLLTNPVGWIMDIIMVLMIVMTYTKSWGKLCDWFNGILKEVGSGIDWLVQVCGDWIDKEKEAVTSWSGWTKFSGILNQIKIDLIATYEWLIKVGGEALTATVSWDGWGKIADAIMYVYDAMKTFYDIMILG
ncbi:MAG: hypothetical protein K8E24_013010, partial [Methanobacterium paludis]|nr:hypothetical protein [Methanobacterium paludis]